MNSCKSFSLSKLATCHFPPNKGKKKAKPGLNTIEGEYSGLNGLHTPRPIRVSKKVIKFPSLSSLICGISEYRCAVSKFSVVFWVKSHFEGLRDSYWLSEKFHLRNMGLPANLTDVTRMSSALVHLTLQVRNSSWQYDKGF